MSDRMAAHICIGGTTSNTLAEELCGAIRNIGASLEWGGGAFSPCTIEELLEANDDGGLRLYDDERAWGEFEDLEEFLREHNIPYDRQSAGKYEYDPEEAIYRPGIGLEVNPTTGSGNPIVEVASLQPVVRSVELLCNHAKGKKDTKKTVLQRAERLQKLLRSKLPRKMPPLEPFVVADN